MKLIFICQNPDCIDYQKEREIEWDGISTVRLLSLKKCPSCNQNMVAKKGDLKQNEADKLLSIATPTIDSMTPAERKALLKKRSTADFHKNIEERKKEMDKNVIPR